MLPTKRSQKKRKEDKSKDERDLSSDQRRGQGKKKGLAPRASKGRGRAKSASSGRKEKNRGLHVFGNKKKNAKSRQGKAGSVNSNQ